VTEVKSLRWWMQRPGIWNVNQLRAKTLDYWHDMLPGTKSSEEERAAWYIKTLLPEELHYATENHILRTDLGCNTLVLLVGYSVEPLLQSISVYEPTNVILLLHKEYVGKEDTEYGQERGEKIAGWITQYLSPMLSKTPRIQLEVIAQDKHLADKPDYVFRALCQHALPYQRDQKDVVVDITGGKKSMDVGAFLFAAYAGIRVSYVDFDEYHPEERRPFGFTCRIGELQNPYEAFNLRYWERVRQLYEQYHFRAARALISDIKETMGKPLSSSIPYALFSDEQLKAVERFDSVLSLYEAWDDGDYEKAYRIYTESIKGKLHGVFRLPAAVEVFGDSWPCADVASFSRLTVDQDENLFMSNRSLLTYAYDELEKIKRLSESNEDSRSTLLRAVGLDELLLKARWVRLWKRGKVLFWDGDERKLGECNTLSENNSLYRELIKYSSTEYLRRALQTTPTSRTNSSHLVFYLNRPRREYHARPTDDIPAMTDHEHHSGTDLTTFELKELRNQAIHKYQYVTPEVAQVACQVTQANFDDFKDMRQPWLGLVDNYDESIPAFPECPGRLSWIQICNLCGLVFLPFHALSEEVTDAKMDSNC